MDKLPRDVLALVLIHALNGSDAEALALAVVCKSWLAAMRTSPTLRALGHAAAARVARRYFAGRKFASRIPRLRSCYHTERECCSGCEYYNDNRCIMGVPVALLGCLMVCSKCRGKTERSWPFVLLLCPLVASASLVVGGVSLCYEGGRACIWLGSCGCARERQCHGCCEVLGVRDSAQWPVATAPWDWQWLPFTASGCCRGLCLLYSNDMFEAVDVTRFVASEVDAVFLCCCIFLLLSIWPRASQSLGRLRKLQAGYGCANNCFSSSSAGADTAPKQKKKRMWSLTRPRFVLHHIASLTLT